MIEVGPLQSSEISSDLYLLIGMTSFSSKWIFSSFHLVNFLFSSFNSVLGIPRSNFVTHFSMYLAADNSITSVGSQPVLAQIIRVVQNLEHHRHSPLMKS